MPLTRKRLARSTPRRRSYSALRNSTRYFSTSFWNGPEGATTTCTRSTCRRRSRARSKLRSRLFLNDDFIRREHIGRAAKLAGDGDLAVLDHVVAIFLRKAVQHVFDAVARARALRADRRCTEDAHAAFVEQPVSQPLARQIRIEQLDVVHGLDQGTSFDPGVVLGNHMRRGAGRRIAWIEIGLARALGRIGQKLQHDAAGTPEPARAICAGAKFLSDGEPHPRRDLLR